MFFGQVFGERAPPFTNLAPLPPHHFFLESPYTSFFTFSFPPPQSSLSSGLLSIFYHLPFDPNSLPTSELWLFSPDLIHGTIRCYNHSTPSLFPGPSSTTPSPPDLRDGLPVTVKRCLIGPPLSPGPQDHPYFSNWTCQWPFRYFSN